MSTELDTSYFISAVKDLSKDNTSLARTLAKVTKVNNEGLTVDIELVEKILGLQEYKNVPVVKDKYANTPILEGDLVLLITLSHLLGNYIETESFNNIINIESYVALPFATAKTFKSKNELTVITPEQGFTIVANDENIKITQKNSTVEITITDKNITTSCDMYSLEAKNSITVESKNSVSIKANSPIEIGTASATIGSILEELINFFTTATTGPLAPSGTTTTINPSQVAQLTAILTKMKAVLK